MRSLSRLLAGALVAVSTSAGAETKPLKVVATLSTFADLVKTIGGEHVEVSAIVSPKFNPHFIEPKPSDVLRAKRADLFVHAGLDLEPWRGPLLDAAGNRAVMPGGDRELDLSQGIALLEVPAGPVTRAHGDIHIYGNPHYWMSPVHGRMIAQRIVEKLCAIDAGHCPDYLRRWEAFTAELDRRVEGWRALAVPLQGTEVVSYHSEWSYLLEFLGLKAVRYLEPKPGIPPTARHVESVEQYVRARGIRAILQASFSPAQAGRRVAKQTGAQLLVLCQNAGELPECADYLTMLEYDIQRLVSALAP
jgi:ABC-type Zn uptake system ZnuABC Zn-binding protein ZnuA